MDTLIVRATRWARRAVEEVAAAEARRSLRVGSYVDEDAKQHLLVLTNHATNDLRQKAIRHVLPSGPIALDVRPRFPVTQAVSLFDSPRRMEENGQGVRIHVESMDCLEGVVLRG